MISKSRWQHFEYFKIRVQHPKYMRHYGNLYSSSNVFVQVCLNVCIGKQWNCHNTVSSKIIKKKSFLSVSLHCFKCNYVKLSVLFVVVLHIEQFDYTFARFVWITCQYDIFFVLNKIQWKESEIYVGGGGEHVQWRKKKELQHCIVTYSQELNIMHTQSILYS